MFGRLLKVDLSSGRIDKENLPPQWIDDYIGGSGLGVRILWEYLRPELDPFDPANPLLWIGGPITGTAGPTTGRSVFCGRSPQTGLWGESNIGGFAGSELRFAGYDALLITGCAEEPVYLWINNEQVEIRSAQYLWGSADTYETQRLIQQELNEPKTRVASIGIAGENQVLFAGIFSDHGRTAARTGLGALMGSKKLKAIAIRGNQKPFLAHEDRYKKLRVEANKDLLQQNMTAILKATGSSGAADYLQLMGDMPQKYWTAATFEGASKVSGAEMADTILVATSACQGCVISCGRVVSVPEGSYKTDGGVKGPEYETICSFGPQLLVDDITQITALGNLCDRLGLDTISAGGVIGLAYLMFERGILTSSDTGGVDLVWGDARPCFDLLEKIACKNGIGQQMALGAKRFAAAYGVEDLAVQINGLEVPTHDPRAFGGQAVAYATSPRGACHNQSDYFTIELGGAIEELDIPMTDRFIDAGKAQYVARHQYWRTVTNSLVYCYFAIVNPHTILELTNAVSESNRSLNDLLRCGERAWNLKRIYNLKLGLDLRNEKLPRLLQVSLPQGGQEGHVPDLPMMLQEYYLACGWNPDTGYPNAEKIESLNLGFTQETE